MSANCQRAWNWDLHRSGSSLVLHSDGKFLPQAINKWYVEDRIAVIATGDSFEKKSVVIPVALEDATCQEIAKTTCKEIEMFKMSALSWGIVSLAYRLTQLQQIAWYWQDAGWRLCSHREFLDYSVLWLACRHHIHEIVLKTGVRVVLQAILWPRNHHL